MKQADEAIERVLAGLRESEAPAGMEGRILQAMQARMAADARGDRAGWRPWLRMPALAVSGAVLAVLLVMVGVSVRHYAGPQKAAKLEPLIKQISDRPPVLGTPAEAVRAQVHPRTAELVAAHAPLPAAHEESAAYVAPDYEALAIEEMNAPSQPTPPLPMTAQERLLRKAVIEEPSDQLAMLNPEERDKAAARADEDFKKFFRMNEPLKQDESPAKGAAEDKPADQKPDAAVPIAANGTSEANSGRR